jgi:acyl-CoA thioester hydrolase
MSAQQRLVSDLEGTRLDRAFFEHATFPCEMVLPVRFDELDVLAHVNNAAAIAMMQEARIAFYHMMSLPSAGEGVKTVVAGLTVEFLREITYPGEVRIGTGIVGIGRTAYTFVQALRHKGALAVCAKTVMVVTNELGTIRVPSALKAALRERCVVDVP